jgi:surfeit locus 1 family protein
MTIRRFRPRLVPTVATVITVPILVSLGFWQLHRAAEKRAIEANYAARSQDEALRLDATLKVDAKALRFYNVTAVGSYDPAYEILVGNRVRNGRIGFEVYTPLHQSGGQTRVLVDRGWIPANGRPGDLPEVTVPRGRITVHGRADVPQHNIFAFKEPPVTSGHWPRLWQTLDLKRYGAAAPFPVQPYVIRLAPDAPGGFLRQWPRPNLRPERSTSYAVQWFAMAFTVVVIFLVVNFKRDADNTNPGDKSTGDGNE